MFLLTSCIHSAYGNLYTGINIGKSSAKLEFKRDIPGDRNDSADLGNNGMGGGLFIGYNHMITETPIIVGIEIGAQNHNLEVFKEETNNLVNQVTKVKTNNSFTGTIKLGIAVKDILFYGKAGMTLTNWTSTFKLTFVNRAADNWNTDVSKKFNKYGIIFGGGIDFKLNSNWAIGIDHTITNYPTLKLPHPKWGFKVNPSIQTTSLRLMYIF